MPRRTPARRPAISAPCLPRRACRRRFNHMRNIDHVFFLPDLGGQQHDNGTPGRCREAEGAVGEPYGAAEQRRLHRAVPVGPVAHDRDDVSPVIAFSASTTPPRASVRIQHPDRLLVRCRCSAPPSRRHCPRAASCRWTVLPSLRSAVIATCQLPTWAVSRIRPFPSATEAP